MANMRFVSQSEFIRQGPREVARYTSEPFQFVAEDDGGVMVQQIFQHRVSTKLGAMQESGVAIDCVKVNTSYDYWAMGHSRLQNVLALKIRDRKSKKRIEDERVASESRGAIVDELAWLIKKRDGDGIHITGSKDSD